MSKILRLVVFDASCFCKRFVLDKCKKIYLTYMYANESVLERTNEVRPVHRIGDCPICIVRYF